MAPRGNKRKAKATPQGNNGATPKRMALADKTNTPKAKRTPAKRTPAKRTHPIQEAWTDDDDEDDAEEAEVTDITVRSIFTGFIRKKRSSEGEDLRSMAQDEIEALAMNEPFWTLQESPRRMRPAMQPVPYRLDELIRAKTSQSNKKFSNSQLTGGVSVYRLDANGQPVYKSLKAPMPPAATHTTADNS